MGTLDQAFIIQIKLLIRYQHVVPWNEWTRGGSYKTDLRFYVVDVLATENVLGSNYRFFRLCLAERPVSVE